MLAAVRAAALASVSARVCCPGLVPDTLMKSDVGSDVHSAISWAPAVEKALPLRERVDRSAIAGRTLSSRLAEVGPLRRRLCCPPPARRPVPRLV